MRLLQSLLLVTVGVYGQDCNERNAAECPDTWTKAGTKCYKFFAQRFSLRDAGQRCKENGAKIFEPETRNEYDKIKSNKDLGLTPRNFFWMFYKLEDPKSTKFPPQIIKVDGEKAPDWINEKQNSNIYGSVPTGAKTSTHIRTGKNRRYKFQFMKVQNGKVILTKPKHRSFGAAAVCEMDLPKATIGDPSYCWQPESRFYNPIEYIGQQTRTDMGYDCADWDDESVHEHNYKPKEKSGNYCRNPDGGNGGPWCYTTDPEQKWDACPILKCSDTCSAGNDFVKGQADCGKRPLFSKSSQRIINGRDAEMGEAPYQARLRYYKKMHFGSKVSDHQCGGTMLSSCWMLTAAHCIPRDGWFTSKGGGEFWFRVDVGNRGFQTAADDFEQLNKLCSNQSGAENKTSVQCEDLINHQALRVKDIFMHPNYRNQDNDLALVQLWPSREDGTCVQQTSTAQFACISEDAGQAKAGDKCMITGWGDVNKDTPGIDQPQQLKLAQILIKDFSGCKEAYRDQRKTLNMKRHMCAAGEGTDTCQGDSGGPLVCPNKHPSELDERMYLTGVVSFGAGCAEEEYPGVYVPVANYYQWIQSITQKNPIPPYDESKLCFDAQCL